VSQYPRTQLEPRIAEVYRKGFAHSLCSPSSFQANSFANLFHLFGQERDRNLSPRDELIELIVLRDDFFRVASFGYEAIKLSIQVAVDDESCVVPVVFPYPVQLHLYDQGVVVV